jgi:hypothetical protein
MPTHPLAQHLAGFDLASYYLGITAGFAEVVAMGCKRLALSAPYDPAMLAAVLTPTKQIVADHGIVMAVEPDLLITPLFAADSATGRTVILLAADQAVLAEYFELKHMREDAISRQELALEEQALAWRFGRLLSYSDLAIAQLLARERISEA